MVATALYQCQTCCLSARQTEVEIIVRAGQGYYIGCYVPEIAHLKRKWLVQSRFYDNTKLLISYYDETF
jgi:hypothetical protein